MPKRLKISAQVFSRTGWDFPPAPKLHN
jgi:hypothetical protein